MKRLILFLLFLPTIVQAQGYYYKITPEPYPSCLTFRVTLYDGQDEVVKDWSNIFTGIDGPSTEDSLFVASVGHRVFLCLDKQLNVKFLFPDCYEANGFHNGYSIIILNRNAGAVNRKGKVVFRPENEFVLIRDDGTIIAGNPVRFQSYYLFYVKNQTGATMGSFRFLYPKTDKWNIEMPTHMTQWDMLFDDSVLDNLKCQEDRLLIEALRNHLCGRYVEAIDAYSQLLQQVKDSETLEAVKYNLLACRLAMGLENTFDTSMVVDYSEIDGLFGTERQQFQQGQENAILFESGLGVLFPDLTPKSFYEPVQWRQRAFFYCFDNTVKYESPSGSMIRTLEDTGYETLKDRLFFPDCLQKASLVSAILQEKEEFLKNLVPNSRQSRGTILVLFEKPNDIHFEFLGDDPANSMGSHPGYLLGIVEFVKNTCETHQLDRLILTFPFMQ